VVIAQFRAFRAHPPSGSRPTSHAARRKRAPRHRGPEHRVVRRHLLRPLAAKRGQAGAIGEVVTRP
jgi:hypothetical protein